MSTHPDIATLVTPLSALRIEGISIFLYPLLRLCRREGGPAKPRPGESILQAYLN